MGKRWKELYFTHYQDGHDLDSALRSSAGGEPGLRWAWDAGGAMLVTNASLYLLRRLARQVDVRLPEHITVPDDDECIVELFGTAAKRSQ